MSIVAHTSHVIRPSVKLCEKLSAHGTDGEAAPLLLPQIWQSDERDTSDRKVAFYISRVKLVFLIHIKTFSFDSQSIRKFVDSLTVSLKSFDDHWTIERIESVESVAATEGTFKGNLSLQLADTGNAELNQWLSSLKS